MQCHKLKPPLHQANGDSQATGPVSPLKNQHGYALAVGLVLLSAVLIVATTSVFLTESSVNTSANLQDHASLTYAATGGTEHAREALRALKATSASPCYFTSDLNARAGQNKPLDGYTGNTDEVGISTGSNNGVSDSVYLSNDDADSATNKTDSNGRARLYSVATGGINGKAAIETIISIAACPPSNPGAIPMLCETGVSFTGSSFLVDGKNYGLNGNNDNSCTTGLGISVSDISPPEYQTPTQALNSVINFLDSTQKAKGQGTGANSTTPSVAADNTLTIAAIVDLVEQLSKIADNYLTLKDGGVITGPINASTDASNNLNVGGKTINLGTTAAPKIIFRVGVGGGSVQADFNGNNSGAGILVVRDNDLIFRNLVDSKGLVIVSGTQVGFGTFGGGGTQTGILGGVIVNENDTDPESWKELVVTGSAKVRKSCEGLKLAQQTAVSKPGNKTASWREVF